MEIFRPSAASTFITFPMADATGFALSGLGTLTGTWIAWADTQDPRKQGTTGIKTLTGSFTEILATAIYTGALASTELPAASPYVMLRFTGGTAATQYLLIRTASIYANVTGINGTAIAAPVTAGYMPVDVKQTISLASPADNSIEKALARQYMAATHYVDAAISGVPTLASALNLTTPTDNTMGKALSRMYMAATNYLDAALSTRAALTDASAFADALLGRTIDRSGSGGRTAGQALMALRNRINITSGTLTVYGTNDTTAEWTAVVATQAVSAIVTDIDPA